VKHQNLGVSRETLIPNFEVVRELDAQKERGFDA
jgi:hypothetical protein